MHLLEQKNQKPNKPFLSKIYKNRYKTNNFLNLNASNKINAILTNRIYKIDYTGCNKLYVIQTKRQLDKCLEHLNK